MSAAATGSPTNRTAAHSFDHPMPTGGAAGTRPPAPTPARTAGTDDHKSSRFRHRAATATGTAAHETVAETVKRVLGVPLLGADDPETDPAAHFAIEAYKRTKPKDVGDPVFNSATNKVINIFNGNLNIVNTNVLEGAEAAEKAAQVTSGRFDAVDKQTAATHAILAEDLKQANRSARRWRCCALTTMLVSAVAIAAIYLTHYPKKLAKPIANGFCNATYDICKQFEGNRIFALLKTNAHPPSN